MVGHGKGRVHAGQSLTLIQLNQSKNPAAKVYLALFIITYARSPNEPPDRHLAECSGSAVLGWEPSPKCLSFEQLLDC
jgi:hypothetical protein